MPRFHVPEPLRTGDTLSLPPGAARHVQVLRLQPGAVITLFSGQGGEHTATVQRMGRSEVVVEVADHDPVEREASRAVHLALGMPANERMDWLIEKATELGVASIQPLQTAHGVLRLSGERAQKKRAHWEAIAASACEQCGRNRVPLIHPVQDFGAWLPTASSSGKETARMLLSLAPESRPLANLAAALPASTAGWMLSGPEGGLSRDEEARALEAGFAPVSLGPRVLRAESAALAALVLLTNPTAG
ncbi:16S rRNA (uracil(1498)-N(3))-methyltransferase [Variovorax dokdonensis]|uniref:Ribosomal RNA small subunit methyltransferase E n=1 Tax=Variovorax dokdonensis TaxID=344883 RepID=A0ABT7N9H6_9BURK|nr:16S rRNA (uracil(1498)-N(3))-methyltransferase [Variovorax dokdonensis]MDM0044568.1 16S rRNA (uracil(1498)-N(3))-methyltransferase [Variovorax dokdonensis]